MNAQVIKPKTEEYKNFLIQPSYKSPGTGRICKTVQGWIISHPSVPVWHGMVLWNGTKREAKEDIDRWYQEAHNGDIEELSKMRLEYIKWLNRVWPSAPVPLKALEEQDRKYQATAYNTQRRRLEPYFKRVTNPKDWKAPINSFCHEDDRVKTGHAIEFFTSTQAKFEPIPENPGWFKVTAPGYRQGPAV